MDGRQLLVLYMGISLVISLGCIYFLYSNPIVVISGLPMDIRHKNRYMDITVERFDVKPQNRIAVCPPWFPDESLFPNKRKSSKVVEKSIASFTSHSKSEVLFLDRKDHYEKCDHVAIRIKARDTTGKIKPYGGDYFRAKLYTSKPYSAVGPDFLFDYDNGTYLALFTLRWTGTVKVDVKLVHSSEAISILKRSDKSLFTFRGGFTNTVDGKKYVENVTCAITPFKSPMCNLSSNVTHAPWFCVKPKNERLSCGNWTYTFMNTADSSKKLDSSLSKAERDTFKWTKFSLDTSDIRSLEVHDRTNAKDHSPIPRMFQCTYTPVPHDIKTSGFYLNGNWQPFNCSLTSFTKSKINSCLFGKVIRFYGDSTARQMYTYLYDNSDCQKTIGYSCHGNNSEIHFTFHGPPVRGKQVVPVKNLRYVAQHIDDLQGGAGHVIILSVWAHFGSSNGTFYRDRLLAIRGAIERLWQRSPETHVIIRSANTREHSIGGFILISSDWVALQGEKTLREVFSSDKRFSFLDVWDMTLTQQSKDQIHPLSPTLTQIMDHLLTVICNS